MRTVERVNVISLSGQGMLRGATRKGPLIYEAGRARQLCPGVHISVKEEQGNSLRSRPCPPSTSIPSCSSYFSRGSLGAPGAHPKGCYRLCFSWFSQALHETGCFIHHLGSGEGLLGGTHGVLVNKLVLKDLVGPSHGHTPVQLIRNWIPDHVISSSLPFQLPATPLFFNSKRTESRILKRNLHSHVHCSTIHNSQDLTTSQMSTDTWKDKENVR